MNKCKRCNYEWKSNSDKKPKACPRCKRYDWNGVNEEEKKINEEEKKNG